MPLAVDITLLGDKELERKLSRLSATVQKKAVRPALRAAAKRFHKRIIARVPVLTGDYLAAVKQVTVRAGKRSRTSIAYVIPKPTEAEFAIQQGALEYGRPGTSPRAKGRHAAHGPPPPMAAQPHIRPAVDENRDQEIRQIGRDIGAGIEREALKP